MCIPSLTIDHLKTVEHFKYESTNKSLTYNYVVYPLVKYLIRIFPKNISPNFFNLLALIFNMIPLGVINREAYNDFAFKLSNSACLTFAICHFIYLLITNLDVSHLSGTITSYSFIFNHWCNIFTIITLGYNLTHLCMIGMDGPISPLFFTGLYLGYYTSAYEEYITGGLHFGYFNVGVEGNLIVVVLSSLAGIFGIQIYQTQVWNFTIGEWIALATFIGSIHCVIMSLVNIYFSKGGHQVAIAFADWLWFYNIVIGPWILCELNWIVFSDWFWLVMLTLSMLFARQTCDMQVRTCTRQPMAYGIVVVVVNIVLFILYLVMAFVNLSEKQILTVLSLCTVFMCCDCAMFVVIRTIEIIVFTHGNVCLFTRQKAITNMEMI